jgi:hypothetical protein
MDLLYKYSIHILDEVDNNAYVKPEYIARTEMNVMATGAFYAVAAKAAGAAPASPAEEPLRPKCGMALSDDESTASKKLLNEWALQAGQSRPGGEGGVGGVHGRPSVT